MRVQVLRQLWRGALIALVAVAAQAQVLPPSGTVTTIGGFGPGHVDGDNSVSQFNDPWGLTVSPSGILHIADFGNNAVRTLNPANNVVSTLIRNLDGPSAVIFDGNGKLLVANRLGGNVRRFSATGAAEGTFATGLTAPTALAMDFDGNIYVAQRGGVIRKYARDGVRGPDFVVPANRAPALEGVAVLSDGSVVASDAANHVLWKFSSAGILDSAPFAGARLSAGFANGSPSEARFNQPHQVAAARNNSLIVADKGNHRVRLVDFSGTTSTLYGADPLEWADTEVLAGWEDGSAATAWSREPVGVVATADGTVFTSEIYWDIVRKVAAITYPTNSNGGGTPPLPGAERNKISLGFESGEASSLFIAAPGQHFISPVVMKIVPNQRMYGLQFNYHMRPNTPTTPVEHFIPDFHSNLMAPATDNFFYPIEPKFYTHTEAIVFVDIVGNNVVYRTNFFPQFQSLILTNDVGNFLGVGWLERYGMTHLYDTRSQDLITYSMAHDTLFHSSQGRIVVGSAGMTIPLSARQGHSYELALGRPSANADGVAADVFIEAPDARASVIGTLSAVRILTITNELRYLVGDVAPFRWFNAGEFGDGSILNNDLEQVHQSLFDPFIPDPDGPGAGFIFRRGYGLNVPPDKSDMYDALDSCCRDLNGNEIGDEPHETFESRAIVDSIVYGDGYLTYKDVLVTIRRALDPGLTNYYRVWRANPLIPGRPDIEGASNLFRGSSFPVEMAGAPPKNAKKFAADATKEGMPSGIRFYTDLVRTRPGQTLQVPIKAEITGTTPVRTIILQVAVRTLDGGALAAPVTITPNAELGPVFANYSKGPNDVGIGWLNTLPDIPAGTITLGTLNLSIPATATADSVIDIKFLRNEAGMDLTTIPTAVNDSILIMENRAAAPWNDEIPDAWRVQHFGSLMNILSAPDADADGDGMNNLEEYRAGTIPTDHASRLALAGRKGPSAFVLSWRTAAGKFYRLEASSQLVGGSWVTLVERLPGSGAMMEIAPPLQNPERAFYRVQVVE